MVYNVIKLIKYEKSRQKDPIDGLGCDCKESLET